MNNKRILRILSFTAALVIAANSALVVNAAIPADGATNAETFASENNLQTEWEDWKSKWETLKENWEFISVTPGSNESERNFAWYSKTSTVRFEVSKNSDMSSPVFSEIISGTADDSIKKGDVQYYAFKSCVKGLSAGKYYYRVDEGEIFSTEIKNTADGFSFIFVGDPQVGSSNKMKGSKVDSMETLDEFYSLQSDAVRSDAFNWNYTLTRALEKSPDAGFILSAGDQIQSRKKDAPQVATDNTFSEIEYSGFLSSEILRSLPFAPTVGNHDSTMKNYMYHFNTPNNSELGSNDIAGGDYWFTYGNALFIVLNTQDTDSAEHGEFIKEAVSANPDSKWRFVTLHQDIYGSAEHSNEPEITNLRYSLIPSLEANDIDVVFSGHDHAYSRTYILEGGKKTSEYYDNNEDEYDEMFEYDIDSDEEITGPVYTAFKMIKDDTTDEKQKQYLNYLNAVDDDYAVKGTENETVVNPDGILYLTAGSSSGSKFYDLTSRMQSYVAGRWQEDIPTYSVVDITDTTFTVNTYRTDTNEKIDTQFSIIKNDDISPVVTTETESGTTLSTESTTSIVSTASTQGSTTDRGDNNNQTSSPKTGVKGVVPVAIAGCIAFAAAYVSRRKKK